MGKLTVKYWARLFAFLGVAAIFAVVFVLPRIRPVTVPCAEEAMKKIEMDMTEEEVDRVLDRAWGTLLTDKEPTELEYHGFRDTNGKWTYLKVQFKDHRVTGKEIARR